MTDKALKNVLLIDNNEIDLFVHNKVLKNYGIENVMTFKGARQAITYLTKTNHPCELILIDNYLPLMDGFEFISEFNKLGLQKKKITICFLYSYISPRQKERAITENIKMIPKPLTPEKLESIADHL